MSFFESNPPPPLPSAPLWERIIFDNPWPTAGVLAVLAVATLALLNRAQTGGALGRVPIRTLIATGLMVAGGVVLALGMAVTTDRQQLKTGTRVLVDAAARQDVDRIDRLLAEDARLHLRMPRAGLPGPVVHREQILELVEDVLGRRYPLREHRVQEVQAALDGPRIARTQVRVRVVPEATQFPNTSWWRVDWRSDEDGRWWVVGIEPLDIPGARLR